ncbi:uncharacterized protein [Elaeis guineensis]|uniref:Uncharacterized protein LOC105032075 isoform X2 n=1 Tax=Elaeis guineensis var. tenera TaxID=51953 RepID=A0A6J0PCS8_ELAGV|nr:uncharacterized protein LOC105032075 isoform X2 [Elaeis guineensis]
MALKLGSSVSNPASILLDSPAHNFPSSRSSSCSPPPSLSHGILVTCPGTNQINTAVFPRSLSSGSNARSTFFKLPRSSGSSSSEGGPEDSKSSDQEKAPFGYTRKDVLLIGIGVTVLGVGLKYGLEFVGVDPLQAGNVVQLVLVLGLTVGWISTYLFRVSNKEMTYAQQLRDYENKVMEKRLEGLTEAELEALLEQVEEEKRRMASDKQL